MLTKWQQALLDIFEAFPCLRWDQLEWIMALRCKSRTDQTRRHVDELRSMKKLYCKDDYIHRLRWGASHGTEKGDLMKAFDVMRQIAGDTLPVFVRGTAPTLLIFYFEDEPGDYRIVKILDGHELADVQSAVNQVGKAQTTFIFLLHHQPQMGMIRIPHDFFGIVPDGKGGFLYLQGTPMTSEAPGKEAVNSIMR